jgi:hypothetical protein
VSAAVSDPTFLDRLDDECVELMADTDARGLRVRLLGGMAIRRLLGDRLHPAFRRPVNDIDVITTRKDSRALEELLAARGWEPEQSFNALNGARRLLFRDRASIAQVDVFVDAFEMCHALPLADRLDEPGPALPATELLTTKLQIVSLNAKDRSDLYALLLGCEVRDGDHRALEPSVLGAMAGRDWGLFHTFELNFAHLRTAAGEVGLDATESGTVLDRIDRLEAALDAAPKTRGWKLRARIGERKRWYEDPEEVDRTAEP